MSQATFSAGPTLISNLFSSHYLDERIYDLDEWDCDDEAEIAFEELQSLWEAECELVDSYKEDELLDSWIDEVLDVLGFDTLSETTLPGDTRGYNDRLLFESKGERREAAFEKKDGRNESMYDLASALLEAKQWNASFEERFSEDRSYRDASHQVKYYLERTPEKLQWGILTNGRKWRLYGTKDYETQTYYEVDLPELIESGNLEAFKYFFVFFRPGAFEVSAGTTFLDTVWNESEAAAQELGEDLQNNVFTALRVLGKGFVETNDLDIDPKDGEALDELKEQSLVVLYRLMFILYAESRNLINLNDPSRRAEYEDNFSLNQLRLDIFGEVGEGGTESGFDSYSSFSTAMWNRLENLFSLIDSGEESLGIPPYNGGLFSEDEHTFLTENEVADRYLAEVIYRISTTETDDGFVPADYADLDTRHLGTIYEGLLEHEFRIAPTQYAAVSEDGEQVWKDATEVSVADSAEQRSASSRALPDDAVETVDAGGLYVVNDDGERKATGAYYTPDYVVTYIVEETVDPLLEDIESDLEDRGLERGTQQYVFRFADEVLDLMVLDPAMGSGHFLTKATGYLAEQVMERVRELETATAFDEQQIRREISRECIYGVDLNGMAVELAKLSMWLETLATNQPLAFLDHHLKAGNSLVGSDITNVLADDSDDDGQLTLTQALARVRQHTLEHVMELMQDLLAVENESYEDIKSMEEIYAEIRTDPLYQRLFEMANVHTAERFGVDVPGDAYEEMAQVIEDEDDWDAVSENDWFRDAQAVAADENFFHWELEFPEVFFDNEGEKSEDAGFDAVVGNPPWVATAGRSNISANMDVSVRSYLEQQFEAANQQFDLYVAFYEQFIDLSQSSCTGIVVPDAILTREQNVHIRRLLLQRSKLRSVLSIGPAFDNVENGAAVLITGLHSESVRCADASDLSTLSSVEYTHIQQNVFDRQDAARFLIYLDELTQSVLSKMDGYPPISERIHISRGEEIGKRSDLLSVEQQSEYEEIVPGGAVIQFGFNGDEVRYIPTSEVKKSRDNYRSPKLIFRQTSDSLVGTLDTESRVTIKSAYNIHVPEETSHNERQLLAIFNSTLLNYYHEKKHAAYRSVFPQINQSTFQSFPVPKLVDEPDLTYLVERQISQVRSRQILNLDLSDYLSSYSDGTALGDVGFQQPISGTSSEHFNKNTTKLNKLEITEVTFTRENPNTLTVEVGVRYKPENLDDYETDTYGYYYEDPKPAFRITDLTETEADLIEAFVPHAVDEAGGYANFRMNATKTNSPLDRLKKLTLPKVEDVRDGLENYIQSVERAEELTAKIERTDELIDEIVYELYGLTVEEIEIVEESVKE
ncbi:Eco57I restriction-modification methylase domain-containing protein [Halogeometricum borinquense]|uniref:Eco57I restriction-modification methylase domain-containing protein n=1 Tax=Halogeometricum borinquense TaxID=60847 RepID=UPI0034425F96